MKKSATPHPLAHLVLLVLLAFPPVAGALDVTLPADTTVKVYFSPRGGARDAIVDAIGQATRTILVQAYSFTSPQITEALIGAHKRGVQVMVILDKGQRGGRGETMNATGVPVWYDAAHAIAHNKVIILDNRTVITGSYNFTKAAEDRNAENLLILDSADLARVYADNWREHLSHSQ